MDDNIQLGWIAGLLEGEGTFYVRGGGHSPVIQVMMTDSDIVIRLAKLMNAHRVTENAKKTKADKSIYRVVVYGESAYKTMKLIYPLMGLRRKEQIGKCFDIIEDKGMKPWRVTKSTPRGAKVIWEGGDSHS